MTRFVGFVLLVLALLAQRPDPDYLPPGDPHAGQPRTCSNSPHIKAVKQDCPCEKKTPEQCNPAAGMEDARCAVYCRKPACKCHHDACETVAVFGARR